MEGAHPVPQNISSFEFRLIGDMTLKQFLYLASGMGIAYLMFVFLASSVPILAWPIIVVSAISGIAFAFLPISDRPLDHWVIAFLKAIYSPAKRLWQKNGRLFSAEPIFASRLNIFLSAGLPAPIQMAPAPTSIQPPTANYQPPIQPSPETLPSHEELKSTVELAKQAQSLQVKILESQRELNQIKGTTKVDEFNIVFNNLQKLVVEAQEIKKQLATVTKEPLTPSPVKVEIVKPSKQKPTQLTLTIFPNVINGIIVDSQGNYLDGVVVVIHNKEGLPVRALKTNKLGQFTGSTPLPNGVYTIELEKENLVFDVLQIELEGKTLPPLTIAAKRVMGS